MPPLLLLTLALFSLLLLIALYARFVEPNRLVVRKFRIDSGRGLSEQNGGRPLRVALLSDFHYPCHVSFRLVRRAIESANAFEPDLALLQFKRHSASVPARSNVDRNLVTQTGIHTADDTICLCLHFPPN